MTDLSARIDAAVQSALNDKRIVGAVIAVMQDGQLAHQKAYGLADREAGRVMKETDIFRLASVTKPIATAAAMRMIELGKFGLTTPITDILPDFRPKLPDGSAPTITIRHLLTHTAGLSYDFMQPEAGPYNTLKVSTGIDGDLTTEETLSRIVAAGLSYPPGAAWLYSMAIDVLGCAMMKIEGTDLDGVVRKYITGPMGMKDTSFFVTDAARLVQPYSDLTPGLVRIGDNFKQPFVPGLAPINLGVSRAQNRNGFQGGGGCMNGTSGEVIRFLDTIRAGGGDILARESAQQMMSNQIGDLRVIFDPTGNTAFGFGGSIALNPTATGSRVSPGSWSWGGVWGHSWSVDQTRKTTILNLTNTTLEGMVGQLVRDVQAAVYG